MALTKDDIIDGLVKEYGLVRREALDFVDTLFSDIKQRVSDGAPVKIPGTGTFFMRKQHYHRRRRNIKLTEESRAWHTIGFRADATLHKRIQRSLIEEGRDVD